VNESQAAKAMFPHYRKLYDTPPPNDEAQYLGYWGEGYTVLDGHDVAIVTMQAFVDGEGYNPSDIQAIRNLRIGHMWRGSTNEQHYVLRVS